MIVYETDGEDNIIVSFTSDIRFPDGFKNLTSDDFKNDQKRRLESLLRGEDVFLVRLE